MKQEYFLYILNTKILLFLDGVEREKRQKEREHKKNGRLKHRGKKREKGREIIIFPLILS